MKRLFIPSWGHLLLLLGGSIVFLLTTPQGSLLLLKLTPCRFAGLQGSLIGTLEISRLECRFPQSQLTVERFVLRRLGSGHEVVLERPSYRDAAQSLEGTIASVRWRPLALWRRKLLIERLEVRALSYRKLPGPKAPPPRPLGRLPLEIGLAQAKIEPLLVQLDGLSLKVDRVELQAQAKGDRILLQSIALQLPEGSLSLEGWLGLEGDFPLKLSVEWRLREGGTAWEGRGEFAGTFKRLRIEHRLSQPFSSTLEGQIEPLSEPLRFDLRGRWRALHWPILSPTLESPTGSFHLVGTLSDYRLTLAGDFRTKSFPFALTFRGRGDGEQFFFQRLEAELLGGRLAAEGHLRWRPTLAWRLRLYGDDLHPETLLPSWPGQLRARATLSGKWIHETLSADVELTELEGTLRHFPIQARGFFRLRHHAPETHLVVETLALQGSSSRRELLIHGQGKFHQEGRWRLSLEGKAPAAWPVELEELSFQVTAHGDRQSLAISLTKLQGLWRKLPFQGTGTFRREGDRLKGSFRLHSEAGSLSLWGHDAPGSMALHLRARLHRTGHFLPFLGRLNLEGVLAGSCKAPHIRLKASGEKLKIGAFSTEAFSLKLRVSARRPSRLELRLQQVKLAKTFFRSLLFQAEGRLPDHRLRLSLADERARLVWLGSGHLSRRRWLINGRSLAWMANGKTRLLLSGPSYRHRLRLALAPPQLDHVLVLEVEDLSRLAHWVPMVEELRGRFHLKLRQWGPLSRPQNRVLAELRRFHLVLPQTGTELDGNLLVQAIQDRVELRGELKSGGGKLIVQGKGLFPDGLDLQVVGDRFLAIDLPTLRAFVSPRVTLSLQQGAVNVRGEVRVPRASVRLADAFEEIVPVSEDEIIAGRERVPEKRFPLVVDLDLLLEEVHFRGYGLEALLRGRLKLDGEGGQPRAYGTVRLTHGLYRAYGQELDIARGTVSFSGPLHEPSLDIVARREIPGQNRTIFLRVSGQLPSPTVTVSSQPPLPQREALAYLLTGHAFAELRRSQRTFLSQVAIRLGLQYLESWLAEEGEKGLFWKEMAHWFQERLLGSLTFAYRFDLEGGALFVRYQLFKWLAIEAEAGRRQSVDLLFTWESDSLKPTGRPPIQ